MKKILFLFVMIFGLLFINSCGDTEDSPTSPDGGGSSQDDSSTTTTLQDRVGTYLGQLTSERYNQIIISPSSINVRFYYANYYVLIADILLKDGAMSETSKMFYYNNVSGEIGELIVSSSYYYDRYLNNESYFDYSSKSEIEVTLNFTDTKTIECIMKMDGRSYSMKVSK